MPEGDAESVSGTRRYEIQVTLEKDLDPDRLEDWCRATFDNEATVLLQEKDGSDAYKLEGGEFTDAL